MDREKIAQAIYGVGWTQKGVHTYPDGLQEEDDYRVTWENTPDERWGLSYAAADAVLALLSPSPDAAGIVESIGALLDLDAKGALEPHGVGGLARELLTKAATALQSLSQSLASKEAEIERGEAHRNDLMDRIVNQKTEIAALKDRISEMEKALAEACAELGRVAGHLATFVENHPEENTSDIEAALYCARLARQGGKP